MRGVYRERYEALTAAVERHAAGILDVVPVNTGMHALVNVAQEIDADALMEDARAKGIEVTSTTPYTLEPASRRNALLLGYGAIDPKAIVKGVQALVNCVKPLR
jgi:GntR family transcriptional regulator/MocR family aminotransferase